MCRISNVPSVAASFRPESYGLVVRSTFLRRKLQNKRPSLTNDLSYVEKRS